MKGKLVEMVNGTIPALYKFRYDAILLKELEDDYIGNLLGEAIISEKSKFNFRRISSNIIIPQLKGADSKKDLWDQMAEFLGVPKIIAASLFGITELNWEKILRMRSDFNEACLNKKLLACKSVWISYGFLPPANCSVQATRQVQLFNVSNYINLNKKAQKDLFNLTNHILNISKL